MKKTILICTAMLIAQFTFAESGKCIALGRVGGEDKVCAQYNDSSEEKCTKADGWAWCAWEKAASIEHIRGTGPILVVCEQANGDIQKYKVNSLYYSGNGTKFLTAMGFGPNRQDDGFAKMTGECRISLAQEK